MTTTKASAFLWESALAMALHNNYYTDFKGARALKFIYNYACSLHCQCCYPEVSISVVVWKMTDVTSLSLQFHV